MTALLPLSATTLSRAERDRQFSPSLSAKDAAGTLERHAAATRALWSNPGLEATRDIAYGPAPRARLDVVRPVGAGPFPCLAFIHGGFWQEGSRAGSGFAAAPFARAGWASALIGYTLAPEARLGAIVAEIAQAVGLLHDDAATLGLDPARLILVGHSAGAHLAAALICGKAGHAVTDRIAGVVLVSGVYDLAPVAASYVNDAVRMDAAEVAGLSVLCASPLHQTRALILCGADEPLSFREQSGALFRLWSEAGVQVSARFVEGRDHFDILDELADPASDIFASIKEMGA